jgi:ribonuclease P protein component
VLPAAARLRRREDFTTTVRRGRRAARGPLVVHLLTVLPDGLGLPRTGFVIPKAVGGAVVRNRLRRRLRALLAARLTQLPATSALVVRALPGAGELDFTELSSTLDTALRAASAPDRRRTAAVPAP